MPVAVITFDEPEFEPSFTRTRNEGKAVFTWLFFTGRCRLADVSLRLLRPRGLARGTAYLAAAYYYAVRSRLARCETVLDVLEQQGTPATFFGVFELIGDAASRRTYLPVYRSILAAGHELGLHGYSHGPLTREDLERSRGLARDHLGVELTTYSSPFGDDRRETLGLLEDAGFRGMRVWKPDMLEGDSAVRRVPYRYDLEQAGEAGEPVVVLNLHSGDCYPWGLGRVKRTISRLKARGYRFVTFGELCAEGSA